MAICSEPEIPRSRVTRAYATFVVAAGAFFSAATLHASIASAIDPAAPTDNESDDIRRANQLMRTGTEQFRKGEFEQARASFLEVWKIKQHPAVAASLGDAEMKLGLWRDAAEHWSFYMDHLPAERDRTEGEAALAQCRAHVGHVRLTVDSETADIYVDGRPRLPRSVHHEIWVDPGDHELEARLQDGGKAAERIRIAAGETRDVALKFSKAAPAALSPPNTSNMPRRGPDAARAVQSPSRSNLRIPVVITGSLLTASAFALGIIYANKEKNAQHDIERYGQEVDDATSDAFLRATKGGCNPRGAQLPSACAAVADSADTAVTSRTIKTAAFLGAGVFGIVTVATYFLWPTADEGRTGRVRLEPWTDQGHGFRLSTSF